jgi:hypothetical protein
MITPEWLAQKCYIDTYAQVHDYNNYYYNTNISNEEKEREYSAPQQYCEVCRYLKLDYRKYYCYTDKGKNRQIITICTDCFRRYQEKRFQLFGKPTGVIAVSDKSKVECLIMAALRLAVANSKTIQTNRRRSNSNNNISSSVSTTTATTATDDVDIHLNPEYDNDIIAQLFVNILIITVLEYDLPTKAYGHCVIVHTKNTVYDDDNDKQASTYGYIRRDK